MNQLKVLISIIIFIFLGSHNSYAGFLSYWSPRNTILVSECKILENDEFTTDAELTLAILDDIMEVSLYDDGDIQIYTSIPLKYATITTQEVGDGEYEGTAYLVKYGGFQLTYANMNGLKCYLIDGSSHGRRIQFNGKATKFYDDSWDVIKKKNGSENRNADDVDLFFHGLYMDKQFGVFQN